MSVICLNLDNPCTSTLLWSSYKRECPVKWIKVTSLRDYSATCGGDSQQQGTHPASSC